MAFEAKQGSAEKLKGLRKVSAFLILLGPEVSSEILKRFNQNDVERISSEIVRLGTVTAEQRDIIIKEFEVTMNAASNIAYGGVEFARDLLEKSLGSKAAEVLINRFSRSGGKAPFEFMKKTDPTQLVNFIQGEHPQTIALVLAYLDPQQASTVLAALPAERKVDVLRRIANMDKTAPEIIKEVEDVLQRKLSALSNESLTLSGGVKTVAEILNMTDRQTEKNILRTLDEEDPDLSNEIKKLMFVFDDIVLIDDRGIQQILKDVDNKELSLALKTASEEVKQKVFKNMSKRAAEAIAEEMEFMGPVRVKQVEEAQQRIVAVIRKLEEAGEIIIGGRGAGDEIIE